MTASNIEKLEKVLQDFGIIGKFVKTLCDAQSTPNSQNNLKEQ